MVSTPCRVLENRGLASQKLSHAIISVRHLRVYIHINNYACGLILW
jgi:hypothetical protein